MTTTNKRLEAKNNALACINKIKTEIDLIYFCSDILGKIGIFNDPQEYLEQIDTVLDEERAFDIEIIYYSRAMDYLAKNDNSLHESMEIASEYGYTPDKLNSEILASLHASKEAQDSYYNWIRPELEDIIKCYIARLEEIEEEEDKEY